jgi:hypothetical protein
MVAVTVSVYVPAGVPVEPPPLPPLPLPPPPQEVMNRSSKIGIPPSRRKLRFLLVAAGRTTNPSSAVAQNQPNDECGASEALVLAIVLALTANVVTVVALTFSLAGTVQVASFGAPVQVSVAVPPIPPPPMESV